MDKEILRKRFDEKWKRADSGCWIWTASTAGRGYGQLRIPGTRRNVYAHRFSFELFKGPLPKGAHLMHKCDNPLCVNPDHLTIGTPKDNAQDMKAKGRHLYGERNTEVKLTSEKVAAIKALIVHSSMSQRAIAEMFGIAQMTVSRIKRGERWGHIAPELTRASEPIISR